MNPLLRARRSELVLAMSRNVMVGTIAPKLAEKYGCSASAIVMDWSRRKQWLTKIVKLDDPTLFHQMVAGLKSLITSAWVVYTKTDNPNAKIGALRTLESLYINIIQILQSSGAIPTVPIKFESVDALPQLDWEGLSQEDKNVITKSARILIEARSKKRHKGIH